MTSSQKDACDNEVKGKTVQLGKKKKNRGGQKRKVGGGKKEQEE